MCIDIFAPGRCIDIDFLHEQIWFDIDLSASTRLIVTEVYDILIRNPKHNSSLTQVHALFPHDCTALRNVWKADPQTYDEVKDAWKKLSASDAKSGSLIKVQPITVNHDMPEVYSKYNWPFVSAPEPCADKQHILWRPLEELTFPRSWHDRNSQYYEGLPLRVKVDFPDELQSRIAFLKLLSKEKVGKTLVRIDFSPGIEPGDKGWLRLIVNPSSLPYSRLGLESKMVPCMPYPIAYGRKLEATCPLVVRAGLELFLQDFYKKDGGDLILENYQDLLKFLREEGYQKTGTSTRISDHRVALVASNKDIDIIETHATHGMDFYGVVPLEDDSPRTAFLWGGGSNRNTDDDLVHNIWAILNKLTTSEGRSADAFDLVRDLAPSGKNLAFRFLIGQMINVGLLSEHEDLVKIVKDVFDEDMESRICQLRTLYSTSDLNQDEQNLLNEFTDIHPFKIYFRVSWKNVSKDIDEFWKDHR